MSTAYHPQTDGQTERVNQSLEQYLRCYVDYNLEDWSRLLSTAEFAYNNQAHESTKQTPFYLEYGRHPRAGPTLIKNVRNIDLNDVMRQRQEAQEQAKAALTLAAERMKWYYDQNVQNVPFKVGNKVLLNLKDYQTTQRALQPRYEGPFEIVEKLSDVMFKLKLPSKYHAVHPVFHASKLAVYNEPTISGQKKTPPQPILVKGEEEWEVEDILQHRVCGKTTQYLVRWKGFGREHNTWELEKNLIHVKDKIQTYKKNHMSARELLLNSSVVTTMMQRDSTLRI